MLESVSPQPSEFLLTQYQEIQNQRQTLANWMLLDPASPYHKTVKNAIFKEGRGISDVTIEPEELFSEAVLWIATHAEEFDEDEAGNTAEPLLLGCTQ